MEQPLISVLMSTYNEPVNYVEQSVASILNQTYKNFEFIIVIDNPQNSELIDYLASAISRDTRVKILINEKNIGLAMSLNRALSEAKGVYIARMDADDIAKTERLEREWNYITSHGLDIIGCAVDKIDDVGEVWGEIRSFSNRSEDFALLLPVQNVFVHPTIMVRSDVIKNVGGYRNFASCQDYDLWLRLLSRNYKFGILDEKLLQFRRHRNSITSTCRYGQILNESYIRILYKERIRKQGEDSFSEQNLKDYLTRNGFYDKKNLEEQNKLLIQYSRGISNIKKHKFLMGMIDVVGSLKSRTVRETIGISIKSKQLKKQCSSRKREHKWE